MKRQTKLAFDMLENEMVCIATEELQSYKGGTGDGSYSGDLWIDTGSGIWAESLSNSGAWSYDWGYDNSGDYQGSGYNSGAYGNDSGMLEDPRQNIDSYVSDHGGWDSWSGGFISGYGYLGATYTCTSSSDNGVMDGLEAAVTGLCMAAGLTSSMTSAVCSAAYGKEWTSLSFESVSGMLKLVGHVAGIGDMIMNVKEIASGDETGVQKLEDYAQIGVAALGIALDATGVGAEIGFGLQVGLSAWEIEEMADGR